MQTDKHQRLENTRAGRASAIRDSARTESMTSEDWRGSWVHWDIKALQSEHGPVCRRPALLLPQNDLRDTKPHWHRTRLDLPELHSPQRQCMDWEGNSKPSKSETTTTLSSQGKPNSRTHPPARATHRSLPRSRNAWLLASGRGSALPASCVPRIPPGDRRITDTSHLPIQGRSR